MPTSVDDIYQYILSVANKNQSGDITKAKFEISFKAAQRQRFDVLKQRDDTEDTITELAPFIIPNATITFSSGIAAKPSTLIKLKAMRYNDYPVKRVAHDRVGGVIKSFINAPSIADNRIYYSESASGYHIYPTTITSGVKIDYLRKPVDVVWGFSIVGGRYVYDAGTSTDSEWDAVESMKIANIALQILGISLNEQELVQFNEIAKRSGE